MKEVVVKNFTLASIPERGNKRRITLRGGLVVRKIGPCCFRLRREDGGKFEQVLYATCSVLAPWDSELVDRIVRFCHVHGGGCSGRDRGCLVKESSQRVPRWCVRVAIGDDESYADVFVFQQDTQDAPKKLALHHVAGFAACFVLRAGEGS
jgi:hypothetical protein